MRHRDLTGDAAGAGFLALVIDEARGQNVRVTAIRGDHRIREDDPLVNRAAAEVDRSLVEWFCELSLRERLRSTSRQAAVLERLARAASSDG